MIASQVLLGASMLGTALGSPGTSTAEQGAAMARILAGNFDTELRAFAQHRRGWDCELSPEQLETVNADVENAKNQLRRILRNAIDSFETSELERQRQELALLRARLSASNKPHPEGTVAELAARFGVSKSEIRRRKTDGTLNELTSKESDK